ncbi:diaminopimelate decarboxylase [Pseudonocardia acaciae]|uniref:diaminopimelate decarboxylase n=1 Tax=Pseudonocardia acaciae TaxID=551276 RepID=UPI00048F14AD|nr:diaminopimelate decarboxylase [Pseudonocardia acaciae]
MTLGDLVPSLRTSLKAKLEPGLWPAGARAGCDGEVTVGGVPLSELAAQHGTPSYVLDVHEVRRRCREYRRLLPGVEVAYAGKAFLCTAMARLVAEEGLSLDVCSAGEIAVAEAAGFPAERMLLHGNVKTAEDVKAALGAGVGRIVLDSVDEIGQLATLVRDRQDVLIRVAPEVDPGTHRAVTTGTADQKFGFGLADGTAANAVARVLERPELRLVGLHCHLGSQVGSVCGYERAVDRMVGLLARLSRQHGVTFEQLNIGGGHGIRYTEDDRELRLGSFAGRIPGAVRAACARHGVSEPRLTVEPGRAIVGPAAVALYRVAAVKRRPGGRTFVAVDGGMSDNPRPALYGARYAVRLLGRPLRAPDRPVTVVGRHCEAGDVLATDVGLPEDVHAGDLLAVPVAGAYQLSMASNYNMVGRPPVVAVADGESRLVVRRESEADLLRREVGTG